MRREPLCVSICNSALCTAGATRVSDIKRKSIYSPASLLSTERLASLTQAVASAVPAPSSLCGPGCGFAPVGPEYLSNERGLNDSPSDVLNRRGEGCENNLVTKTSTLPELGLKTRTSLWVWSTAASMTKCGTCRGHRGLGVSPSCLPATHRPSAMLLWA